MASLLGYRSDTKEDLVDRVLNSSEKRLERILLLVGDSSAANDLCLVSITVSQRGRGYKPTLWRNRAGMRRLSWPNCCHCDGRHRQPSVSLAILTDKLGQRGSRAGFHCKIVQHTAYMLEGA